MPREDARDGDQGWTLAEFLGSLEKLENFHFNANEKALKPDRAAPTTWLATRLFTSRAGRRATPGSARPRDYDEDLNRAGGRRRTA